MLPNVSQASITKGIWLVHNDGINTIHFFGSNTGKEKVFLNEALVSEKRSLKLNNHHEFQDANGSTYEIKCATTNLMKGEMTYAIYKNTEVIKNFELRFERGNNINFKRLLILVILSVAYAIISHELKLPDFMFFIFVGVMLTVHFMTRKSTEIIIKEE